MLKSFSPGMIGIQADAQKTIDLAARFGFDAVDLPVLPLEEASRIADELAQKKLKPGTIGGLLPGKLNAPEADWQKARCDFDWKIKSTQKTGYYRTGCVLMPFSEDLEYEANYALHVNRLKDVMPILETAGIYLGLEYVSPLTRRKDYQNVFIHDAAGLRGLIEDVGSPNLGVLLDSFHWYCARETQEVITTLGKKRIVIVHVNDAIADRPIDEQSAFERDLPGATGVIDLQAFMGALQEIGYDGPVTVEPMNQSLKELPEDERVRKTSESLKRLF